MGTPQRFALSVWLAAVSGLAAGVSEAQYVPASGAQSAGSPRIIQIAAATTGTIAGQVLDDRGQPLADVVVSAVGGSTSFAVSDRGGQFTLSSLTPGPYLVRAHRDGYVAARQSIVTVRASARTMSTFRLRRDGVSPESRLVAGVGAIEGASAPVAENGRDESETAWRMRRLKRSILKDSTDGLEGLAGRDDWFVTDSLQFLGRAVESSARIATALFTHSPLKGQVNLLTTGAFDTPGELLQMERTRGVAFFSLGAPVGSHGEWTVKAALNHGDLSSWIVTGDYVTRVPVFFDNRSGRPEPIATPRHRYQFGMSYGVHSYEGGNLVALAAMNEAARNVGAVYAHDEWKVSERLTLGYGGHYAHYDYLLDPAHLSPRLSATVQTTEHTRLLAVASRRVSAPGAEEFLTPAHTQVLPPQRTFSPLTPSGFRPEDMQHYELGFEHLLDGVTVGVRAFQQVIGNQAVTVFGLRSDDTPRAEVGHYYVGSAGDVDVKGLTLSLTHSLVPNVRGAVEYSTAGAEWANERSLDRWRLLRTTPSALRADDELIHDLTTTVETDFPQSATRIFVLYKINSAYASGDGSEARPGLDGRWDVQVVQGLPFMNFTSANWEMLVGIRNLFRESFAEMSVYDELLVVRPPKRLVGGITVKF